jgi:hypothetical protein
MRGWRAKQAQCMTESRGECPGSLSQWMSIHTRALCDRPPLTSAICTTAVFSAGVSSRPSRSVLYIFVLHLHLSLTIVPVYCTIFRGTRGDFWGQLWDSSPYLTIFSPPGTIRLWRGGQVDDLLSKVIPNGQKCPSRWFWMLSALYPCTSQSLGMLYRTGSV